MSWRFRRLILQAKKSALAWLHFVGEPPDSQTFGSGSSTLRLFSKARAASALAFALIDEPGELHEAIYEAIAALDDPSELVRAVESALR